MNDATTGRVVGALGLGRLVASPSAVARGAMGEVWRVQTERGVWAVKALFPWAEYPPRPPDVEVQLAALDAGIALPRPVLHDGVAIVDVDSRSYRAYEWVDLAMPLRSPIPVHVAHAAGRILGVIHTLPLACDDDLDDWYTTAPEPAELLELAAAAKHAGEWWGSELEATLPLTEDLRVFAAVDHAKPTLCHRDFDVSNVLPSASTNSLVTLDWENVGPLAPDEEVASALLTWCTASGSVDERSAAAFLESYRAIGGSATIRPDRSFSMAVCTSLNFLRVMAEQALQRDEHLSFADAQLKTMLRHSLAALLSGIRAVTNIVA